MLQIFGEIGLKGAVTKKDALQAAARSYARLLRTYERENSSPWYQDLKKMSADLLETMEKDPEVAKEDKDVLSSAIQKKLLTMSRGI